MPASIGRSTNLLEEGENSTDLAPPTLPPLSFEETDHHILDLLLNESFSELEFDTTQSIPPINSSNGTNMPVSHNIDTNISSETADLRSFEINSKKEESNSEKEEINTVLLSQVNIK